MSPGEFQVKTGASLARASLTEDAGKYRGSVGILPNNNCVETSSSPFFKCKNSKSQKLLSEFVCKSVRKTAAALSCFAAHVSCRCVESVQAAAAAAAALTHTDRKRELGRVCKHDKPPSESLWPSRADTRECHLPRRPFPGDVRSDAAERWPELASLRWGLAHRRRWRPGESALFLP